MPSGEQRQGVGAVPAPVPSQAQFTGALGASQSGAGGMDPAALAAYQQQQLLIQQQQQQQQQQQWLAQAAAAAAAMQQQQQMQAQQLQLQQQLALQQQQVALQQQQQQPSRAGSGVQQAADDEEEEEEDEDVPAADPDDSDYTAPDEEEEEEEESGAGRRRRRGDSDDESESDPDYQDARAARKRRRAPTPPGTRRSVRIKDRVIDVGGELEGDEVVEEQAPRRGLRSLGPVQAPEPSVPPSGPASGSRAGSEQPAPKAPPQRVSALATLPNPKDIRREHSEEEMAAELAEVKNMWEMSAILDYLTLYKKQLNLSRQFAASELEHVLAFSDGRDGLLADLHIDIMHGISPKQPVPRDAWQVHLANKIKYHWRPLLSGLHCPFKPDKYFEAYQYARLPAADRVRALHFLCTIRCDREDIQNRVTESYIKEWTPQQLQMMLALQQDAIRRGRPDEAPVIDMGTDSFRRQPNGLDRNGARYFILDFLRASDFRMYRESAAGKVQEAAAPAGEEGKGTDGGSATAPAAGGGSSSPEDQAGQEAPKEPEAAATAGAQQAEQAAPQAAEAGQEADEAGAAALRQEGTAAAAAAAGPKQDDDAAEAPTPEQEVTAGAGDMEVEGTAAVGDVKVEAAAADGDAKQDAALALSATGAAAAAAPERKAEPRAAPPAAAAAAAAAMAQPWAAAMAALPGAAALPQPWAAAAAAMAAAAARSGAAVPWGMQWQAAMGLAAQQQQEEEEEGESWSERRERLLSYRVPGDPEPEVHWELVASTLQEFEDFANRFASGGHPDEALFAMRIRQYVIPTIVALKEEEDRRAKAAERVQRKLGVAQNAAAAALPPVPAPVAGAAPAGGASGSGGSGAVTGSRSAAAGVVDGGRSRRARTRVNYAFVDYDETLRSAIRHTQRGEEDSEDEQQGRRRRRRAPSPSADPVEAARGGLRRGRSAAAIKDDLSGVNAFVDERQLRAAVAYGRGSRAGSRAASRTASDADLARLHEQEQEEAAGAAGQPMLQGMGGMDLTADGQPQAAYTGAQVNGGALQEADASAYVSAAPGRGRGRGRGGGSGRGRGRKPAKRIEYREFSEEEDESEAEGEAVSEDEEYVPRKRR